MKTFISLSKDKRKEIIELMKRLRREGKTYSEIQNFFIGKNIIISYVTIYRNLKDMKMSHKGLIKYKEKLSASNKQKPFVKNIKIKKGFTKEKSRFISHCLFDGHVQAKGDWEISYSNISKTLVDQFCNDLCVVFGIKPLVRRIEMNGSFGKFPIYRARCHSVRASEDLLKFTPSYSTESKTALVPKEIINSDRTIKKFFLRAFWDNEGAITIDKNNVRLLQSTCPNNKIRGQLIQMHKQFGIKSSESDNQILRITRQRNIRKFREEIGFSPGVFISAKSKKWQTTEKTKLLQIVLNSYRRGEYNERS